MRPVWIESHGMCREGRSGNGGGGNSSSGIDVESSQLDGFEAGPFGEPSILSDFVEAKGNEGFQAVDVEANEESWRERSGRLDNLTQQGAESRVVGHDRGGLAEAGKAMGQVTGSSRGYPSVAEVGQEYRPGMSQVRSESEEIIKPGGCLSPQTHPENLDLAGRIFGVKVGAIRPEHVGDV